MTDETMPAPRDEVVQLGDWAAHVVRWPGDAAHPMLLLHGFTGHARTWQHLASVLAPRHDGVALDQRGHGASAPTDRYGSRPMVDDVSELLDRLGWARTSIVGHSMGGVNAFVFAAGHPARVERLVIVDIAPEPSPVGLARIRANVGRPDLFASFEHALADARLTFPEADDTLLRLRVTHNLVATGDGHWTWRTAAALRDGSAARHDHSVDERWAAWGRVRAPTLLVHGTASDVLTPDLVTRMAAARPAIRTVEIEGATHAVPLDRPVALADAVAAFLDEPST